MLKGCFHDAQVVILEMNDFLERISTLSPKRTALLALELHEQVERLKREEHHPIAIIGMGCRFPGGADSPRELWQLLQAGRDAIVPAPSDRWNLDQAVGSMRDNEGRPSKQQGGFLERVDLFDPLFFGVSPREAESMDPQQRLLLEVAWEALEDAGLSADDLQGSRTGIFVGIAGNDFSQRLLDQDAKKLDAYVATGSSHAVAAGRLSYTLNLAGPCLSIDTACSSSLVAVSAACDSLRLGRATLALTGGVSLILSPETTFVLAKGGMLSPDFRCKTFDAAANGFVRGEGCGLLVLKRLTDAQRDGDRILAVIRGTAVNQDGRSIGLTAPNGPAQQSLLREALADAKLTPAQVQFVEAHGTGTSLGDPIEAQALAAVFGPGRPADQPLLLGSIKTNFGHLEAAAGVAGLMKLVLAIEHGEIPPMLHLKTPNPHVDWSTIPLSLPTEATPWPGPRSSRIGGVSSFGFSGTNAHLVLSNGPKPTPSRAIPERPQHLLCLSAKSDQALRTLASRYADFLADHRDASLADIAFTSNRGRVHHSHRLAMVGGTNEEMRERLLMVTGVGPRLAGRASKAERSQSSDVVFLFAGQGSQYPGMSHEIYRTQPTFRATLDRCDEILRGLLERSLVDVLFSGEEDDAALLNQTAFTQPALFAIEFALADLLRSWGVRPAAVLGHSVGEYVAACLAGVFTLEDGLNLVAARARLMQSLPAGGGMVSVLAAENEVVRALAPFSTRLSIAAFNGPTNVVVSGPLEELGQFVRRLEAENLPFQRLEVSHAFHSALLDPMLDDLERAAGRISYAEPRCTAISNLTGRPATSSEMCNASYWRMHARQPVRFASGMRSLRGLGYKTFIEIGPTALLSGMARRIVTDPDCRWLPTLRKGRSDWEQLLESLGELYTIGLNIDWAAFDRDYPRCKLSLPTYPFERLRYWPNLERHQPRDHLAINSAEAFRDWLYELEWQSLNDTGSNETPTSFYAPPSRLEPVPAESDERVPVWSAGTIKADAIVRQVVLPAEEAPRPTNLSSSRVRQGRGRWLLWLDEQGTGRQLAASLRECGEECLIVRRGTQFESLGKGEFRIRANHAEDHAKVVDEFRGPNPAACRSAIYLWALDALIDEESTLPKVRIAVEQACCGALFAAKAIVRAGGLDNGSLVFVTRGGQSVGASSENPQPAQTALWGLGGVVGLEHPEVRCRRIDLDGNVEAGGSLGLLKELLRGEHNVEQIALRGEATWALRMKRAAARNLSYPACQLLPNASYLVTGGLTGLGLETAGWLVERGAKHLVLVGRRAAGEHARAAITAWTKAGAEILCCQADIADPAEADRVFTTVSSLPVPLRGVIHAAGSLDDAALLRQDWSHFERVLNAKVEGAWNLHTHTRSVPLDFFVLFSSGASLLGSVGQANYAAANAFLDGLAHYRRSHHLAGLSINWGAWGDIGMAARHDVLERIAQFGMSPIDVKNGLEALECLLAAGSVRAAVLPIDWSKFLSHDATIGHSPFFAEFRKDREDDVISPVDPDIEAKQWRPRLQSAAPSRRHLILREMVEREAAKILGLKKSQTIDPQRPLQELGLDSLMAIQFRNILAASAGIELSSTILYNCPTVEQLTAHLAKCLTLDEGVSECDDGFAEKLDEVPDQLSEAELEELSEEELARLLQQQILSK
jgi:acyl transferase domain-containing protein/acyl carrier protein